MKEFVKLEANDSIESTIKRDMSLVNVITETSQGGILKPNEEMGFVTGATGTNSKFQLDPKLMSHQ